MMKTATRFTLALLAIAATNCNEYVPKAQVEAIQAQVIQLRKELDTEKAPQVGRWRIEIRTSGRADTYLIDTVTGRVWREYMGSDRLPFWLEMAKSDKPWTHTGTDPLGILGDDKK